MRKITPEYKNDLLETGLKKTNTQNDRPNLHFMTRKNQSPLKSSEYKYVPDQRKQDNQDVSENLTRQRDKNGRNVEKYSSVFNSNLNQRRLN